MLNQELYWAASRPESRWGKGAASSGSQPDDPDFGEDPEAFEKCLTTWEHKAYEKYLAQWPNSVYSMNQNPDVRPTYATDKVFGPNLNLIYML